MLKEKKETFNQRAFREGAASNPSWHTRKALYSMPPGAERRKAILEHCPLEGFPVNRKHTLQIHKDRDLKYLLKKGLLKRITKLYINNRYTYLVKA